VTAPHQERTQRPQADRLGQDAEAAEDHPAAQTPTAAGAVAT
jgi:hypothetical protein